MPASLEYGRNAMTSKDFYRTGKYMGAIIAIDLLREFFPNTIDQEAEDMVLDHIERNIDR